MQGEVAVLFPRPFPEEAGEEVMLDAGSCPWVLKQRQPWKPNPVASALPSS